MDILPLKVVITLKLFGTWGDIQEPVWETYLDRAPEDVIRETELSREELKRVLQVLHEHRIIH